MKVYDEMGRLISASPSVAHKATHENGGADEISVAGLSGLLADDQHVLDAEVLLVAAALVHATRHQNGGADEISVAGLSGLLADDQHVLDAEVKLIKLDDFAAPDDNTDLDATISAHGLMPKADKSKLDGIEALADVTDATNVAAAGAVMDSDFTAADEIMVGTGAGTHGQVTLAASQFLAKKATGAATNVTAAEARTILNVADGANAYVHPNHSGDVTSVADGAQTIAADAVTYAKMQNVSATDKVLGRSSVGAGDVEEIACTAAGRALLDDADAAAQRTTLGLVIGTNVQAYDAELAALAGLTSAADKLPYFTGSGTAAVTTLTAFGRSLIDDAAASNARTTLGLVIGTNVLAYDAGLSNLAGVAMVADRFYYTSADNVHVAGTVTAFARSILDDADEATFKATVNLEIGTDVLAQQTIGIADDNLVEIDDADAADNDYCKLTANGIEGRSYSEVMSDLSGQAGATFSLNDQILSATKGILNTAETELTISTGAITVTQFRHTIDTEGDAASDDLDTVNGGTTVNLVILRAENDARTVVVKHNTGNIWLSGGADISLDNIEDAIMLAWDATNSKWFDVGWSAVGAAGADEKVGVDSGATAGYLGAASNDGVLRTSSPITYTDGGDYITLAIQDAAADDSTKGVATFEADDFDSASGKIDLANSVTKQSTTDSGTATPTAHDLGIVGGEGIDTSGSGTQVIIAGEDASTTNKGIAELATATEITTGTDTGRTITPDGLAGSGYGKRTMSVLVNDSTALTSGDGKAYFPRIPSYMNGWNIIEVAANMVAGTGAVTIMIHNLTQAADILSTALTIDANEKDSKDAATPAVIDTAEDDLQTGDRLRIDIDGAGTGTTWLDVQFTAQLP